jgi:hypothetical protein
VRPSLVFDSGLYSLTSWGGAELQIRGREIILAIAGDVDLGYRSSRTPSAGVSPLRGVSTAPSRVPRSRIGHRDEPIASRDSSTSGRARPFRYAPFRCAMISASMHASLQCGQKRTAVLDHRARLFHNTMSSDWVLMIFVRASPRARTRRAYPARIDRRAFAEAHERDRRPRPGRVVSPVVSRTWPTGRWRCDAVRRGSHGYPRPWR